MEKGQGKRADTLQTDNVFTRKEYIERNEALEKLLQCADVYDPECSDITVAHAMRKISAISAADVVPVRHGKWREVENGESGHLCECSACKEWLLFYYGFVANYCPNCGARMGGDGE